MSLVTDDNTYSSARQLLVVTSERLVGDDQYGVVYPASVLGDKTGQIGVDLILGARVDRQRI